MYKLNKGQRARREKQSVFQDIAEFNSWMSRRLTAFPRCLFGVVPKLQSSCGISGYQRASTAPQVNPPPIASMRTRLPS